MASDPLTLGTRIRRARERKRLSQVELATEVGASVRAVSDWENDKRKPRNRLGTLEEVLGVRLDGEPDPGSAWQEQLEDLRDHIREVMGPGSPLEAALDASLSGKPSSRNAGGAGGRPSRQAG